MKELGAEEIYIDKAGGKNTEKPQLQKMLFYIRRGNTVIVKNISRFARDTKDLLELIEILIAKEATFISKKEAIDTITPIGKFMMTIFGAVAELERDIFFRQHEDIAIANSKVNIEVRSALSRQILIGGYPQGANMGISTCTLIFLLIL